jgi:hypothetical protein
MTSDQAIIAMVEALEASGLPYMVVGSLSSNYYGVPRSTRDADFVIELQGRAITEVLQHLGPEFQLEEQMAFETVTATRRYKLQVRGTPFEVELFLLTGEPHDQSRFSRRRRVAFYGRQAFILSPEDVVVTKLRWSFHGNRLKDRDDVRNVLAVQAGNLDWDYLRHWCHEHGTLELLNEISASLPQVE